MIRVGRRRDYGGAATAAAAVGTTNGVVAPAMGTFQEYKSTLSSCVDRAFRFYSRSLLEAVEV